MRLQDSEDPEAQLKQLLRLGEVDTAIRQVTEVLEAFPTTMFQLALKSDFTNSPELVADYLDGFYEHQRQTFSPSAMHAEMNGFSINPEQWYFTVFGYLLHGGHDNYDWLADSQSSEYSPMTLRGMEDLQGVYKYWMSQHWVGIISEEDERKLAEKYGPVTELDEEAQDWADILVVCKFQRLLKQSLSSAQMLSCPVLGTAHDFNLIAEFTTKGIEPTRGGTG